MPYPVISSHRLPYDIDGTEMCQTSSFISGITSWFNSDQRINFNNPGTVNVTGEYYGTAAYYYWFLPHKNEIEALNIECDQNGSYLISFQGSNDTTNGVDGTWETAVMGGNPCFVKSLDNWRGKITSVSFAKSYKTLRMGIHVDRGHKLFNIHIYGRKAAGEQPDDVIFCNTSGVALTALTDFGDRPEGTTEIKSFKLKNISPDKIANAINLQLNHSDFLLSFSSTGPWSPTLDITSIGPESVSNTIYINNQLNPPLLSLGPKYARIILNVGSFD